MFRDTWIIVRLDSRLVPAVVSYVGHGETPHDFKMRWTCLRESATRYGSRRVAMTEARRLARVFSGRFSVVGYRGRLVFPVAPGRPRRAIVDETAHYQSEG